MTSAAVNIFLCSYSVRSPYVRENWPAACQFLPKVMHILMLNVFFSQLAEIDMSGHKTLDV